ncbi:uncharacterized protein BHQ10_008986 [Talaromyces amestolkiae]|uniref:Uncharacterized protein n=1 Tax=Talaromyces amestolkiae TaxID=1196081 RepID=A0A364LAY5_TALAM|nr:uncharacterized protein BHQ10_008986 [Talaromyces amestolkiae]RAO72974.1 hypothetical protein BHQ10_008986 [Talaromyces amestolkiae]
MDPETEFDTDTMILDYVCSKATHALLLTRIAELSDRPAHADVDIVKIFDTWHLLTTHKHGATRQISRDLDAKLRLISFTAQFLTRARKSEWRDSSNGNSRPHGIQGQQVLSSTAYMTMLEILRIPREQCLDDRRQVLSLIDLFPDFLDLCFVMRITENEESLIEVLGKYTIQAVLEQYTLFGKTTIESVTHASSLLLPHQPPSSSQSERKNKWLSEIQSTYLTILHPPPPPTASQQCDSHETHLNRLAQQFPTFEFEAMLVMKLQKFLFGLETPLLVKLETGEINPYEHDGGGGE